MAEQEQKAGEETPREKERLGAYLKRAREAARIDLATLAREKRLSREYLEAIEASRWEALPGPTYIRAYLTSLAQPLRLDREKILQWYSEEVGLDLTKDQAERIEFHRETEEIPNKMGRPSILVLLFIVAIVIFAIKTFKDEEMPDEVKEFLPASLKDSAKVVGTDSNSIDSTTTTDSLLMGVLANDNLNSSSTTAPPTALLASTASSSTLSSIALGRPHTVTSVPSRLQITCPKDSSWIQIQSKGSPDWAIWVRQGGTKFVQTRTDTMVVRLEDWHKLELELNFQPLKVERNQFRIFNGRVLP